MSASAPLSPFKYYPSNAADVHVARRLLMCMDLPAELARLVLEYAEYWPNLSYSRPLIEPYEPYIIADRTLSLKSSSAQACLITSEIPCGKPWDKVQVKEVYFRCTSADQGWTTEDTHGKSCTCRPYLDHPLWQVHIKHHLGSKSPFCGPLVEIQGTTYRTKTSSALLICVTTILLLSGLQRISKTNYAS
jgi:hypothetical protein